MARRKASALKYAPLATVQFVLQRGRENDESPRLSNQGDFVIKRR